MIYLGAVKRLPSPARHLKRTLRIVARHHPHCGLQESHRVAHKVPKLHARQVDDDRDALGLSRLQHLNIATAAAAYTRKPETTKRGACCKYHCINSEPLKGRAVIRGQP